jgi:hypothetical protein
MMQRRPYDLPCMVVSPKYIKPLPTASTKVGLVRGAVSPPSQGMPKRIFITILWLAVGWTLGSMLTFFVGFPPGFDLALSVLLGVIVYWDPAHLIWASSTSGARTVRPVDEVAEDLERGASQRAGADGDRARI